MIIGEKNENSIFGHKDILPRPYNPFLPSQENLDKINDIFKKLNSATDQSYDQETIDNKTIYYIDLAGYSNIDIKFENKTLLITADRERCGTTKKFSLSIPTLELLETDQITADHINGVLKIEIVKTSVKIPIKSSTKIEIGK